MLPDQVSNPGPLTYESGALPIALRGPAEGRYKKFSAAIAQKYSMVMEGISNFKANCSLVPEKVFKGV